MLFREIITVKLHIVTRLWTGQQKTRGSILRAGRDFSLLYLVQIGSEAHTAYPASYSISSMDCFPGNLAAGE
jgi:hypothetical protein